MLQVKTILASSLVSPEKWLNNYEKYFKDKRKYLSDYINNQAIIMAVGGGTKGSLSKRKPPGGHSKKKKKKLGAVSKQVDAFGNTIDDVNQYASNTNESGRKGKKKSKKSSRSPVGFLVLAATTAVAWTLTILQGIRREKKSTQILSSMRKRKLTITEHAACRMDCRFVSKGDVMQSLFRGRVNVRKSNPKEKPCPKYVVDAEIRKPNGDYKTIQTVFSACDDETKLITAIDTKTNWPCGPC